MRIGTWNLAGRWDERHAALLLTQDCDVWLLTEVNERLAIDGYTLHATAALMAPRRRWAAILSRQEPTALPDPHPASALARVGALQFCSSILPWRSCGSQFPWEGTRHADKTEKVLEKLRLALPQSGLVWGGDWNQALAGEDYAGSQGGRRHLLDTVDYLELQVTTSNLPHRLPNILCIDHIAVNQAATVVAATQIDASDAYKRLSDHDAYVVEFR